MNGTKAEIPDLLSERTVAELLGISRESAMALCRANRIPARKVMRGRYLISKRMLVDWVEKGSGKA